MNKDDLRKLSKKLIFYFDFVNELFDREKYNIKLPDLFALDKNIPKRFYIRNEIFCLDSALIMKKKISVDYELEDNYIYVMDLAKYIDDINLAMKYIKYYINYRKYILKEKYTVNQLFLSFISLTLLYHYHNILYEIIKEYSHEIKFNEKFVYLGDTIKKSSIKEFCDYELAYGCGKYLNSFDVICIILIYFRLGIIYRISKENKVFKQNYKEIYKIPFWLDAFMKNKYLMEDGIKYLCKTNKTKLMKTIENHPDKVYFNIILQKIK